MNTPARSPFDLRKLITLLAIAPLTGVVLPSGAVAQQPAHDESEEHSHENGEDGHHGGLHFTHPLIAESVSPDTKVRLDHQFFDFPDGDTENSGVFEAEYAVTRSFSIEAGLPYSYSATEFGNAEVLFKFANYAFEGAGLLLGYGLELGFPTNGTPEAVDAPTPTLSSRSGPGRRAASGSAGDRVPGTVGDPGPPGPRFSGGGAGVEGTLGTDEWEVAPFLNVGWKRGPVELVAWGIFGIPFNQAEQEEVATELSYNVSAMYHVSSRVQALLELDGSGGISGPAVGEDVANLSPGLRVQLLPDTPVVLGTSVGFPLASGVEEDPFDLRWQTSFFWHF